MSVKRDQKVVKETKLRDKACQRCMRVDDLICHHKVALSDGGLDDLENTITLCDECHKEWHHVLEGEVEFETFLNIPTGRAFLFFAANDKLNDYTLGDIKKLFPMQRMLNFGIAKEKIVGHSTRTKLGIQRSREEGKAMGRRQALPNEIQKEILEARKEGASLGELADRYGVSRAMIQRIEKRNVNVT